jgi:hypothetical protein
MPKANPPGERPWRIRYNGHKSNAKVRGIEFLLTFEEWRDIWLASGKWEERGNFSWSYCMSRKDDMGPYAVGNVHIITQEQNLSDSWRSKDSWRNKFSRK